MPNTSFGDIREGMNCCDRDGNKIGTIKTVEQLGRSLGVGGVGSGMPISGVDGYLHVDTGFLGLGKDLYIPLSAVRNCTTDCCFLNVTKDDVDRMGWDMKPSDF